MIYSLLYLNELWAGLPLERRQDYLLQLQELYRQAGWWSDELDTLERLERIISGSCCFLIAENTASEILGMGRAICDGVSDAYLQDITVKSDVRRRGVASQIVETLVRHMESIGIAWIGLIAKAGTDGFYGHFGFSEIHEAIPMLKIKLKSIEPKGDVAT